MLVSSADEVRDGETVLERLELGRFRRTIWPHEAHDFTPWLGHPENIGLLGDALGMELFVEEVEQSAGPYSADIVARDTDDAVVVIENQPEKTNHDHFASASHMPRFLMPGWLFGSPRASPMSTKKAFDWLNDKTGLDISFFAVRLLEFVADREIETGREVQCRECTCGYGQAWL